MRSCWNELARRWALQKTRKELYALSDHMLRDIGLRREQLSSDFLKKDAPVSRGVVDYGSFSAWVRVPYFRKLRG